MRRVTPPCSGCVIVWKAGKLESWNTQNPDQPIVVRMPDVWKRVREMDKDRCQRIADTAPKALRAKIKEDLAQARV